MSAGSMAVWAGRGLNESLEVRDNSSPRGSYKVEEGRLGGIFITSFNNKGVQTRTSEGKIFITGFDNKGRCPTIMTRISIRDKIVGYLRVCLNTRQFCRVLIVVYNPCAVFAYFA